MNPNFHGFVNPFCFPALHYCLSGICLFFNLKLTSDIAR